MQLIELLINIILVALILARIPNQKQNVSSNIIDQNPKIISRSIPIFLSLFLIIEIYNNI